MKRLMICAAVLVVGIAAGSAAQAQDSKTVEPNRLTVQTERPSLKLSDRQQKAIDEALATENTEQKTPLNFQPKAGDPVPLNMNIDVMPPRVLAREPSLQPYGYAKLATDVLVIDPMKKTIIAVIPRSQPSSGKPATPADWAKTRGRELTGQAPESTGGGSQPHEPAGDTGDRSNGTEQNAREK